MPRFSSLIDACPDCCSCPDPTALFFPNIVATCTSRTGTATLCGISGYDDGSYNPSAPEA